MPARPKYRRVLLKLSGEALGTGQGEGVDLDCVESIAREIAGIRRQGVEMAVVVGGGNIIRGADLVKSGMAPAVADTMGMLATVINGLALHDALRRLKVESRVQTAIRMPSVAEPYVRERCVNHLKKRRVVILAGGTGSPHFTTDTAAALRAREIHADVLLKGTSVDGVYSDDPRKNAKARRYTRLSYQDMLRHDLRVMDAAAVALCRDGDIPIIVFDRSKPGSLRRVVFSSARSVGTYIGRQ